MTDDLRQEKEEEETCGVSPQNFFSSFYALRTVKSLD
jgi:hypothetical protein